MAKESTFSSSVQAKGFTLVLLSALLFLSLLSFTYGEVEKNWLGVVGYLSAIGMNYVFGLGSYAVLAFLMWVGGCFVFKRNVPDGKIKCFYFSLFLLSLCILLNLFAEMELVSTAFFKKRVHTITLGSNIIRLNLGGAPFYYLLKDLPSFNLQNLLSNTGIMLTFGMIGIISFFLLTQINFFLFLKTSYRFGIGVFKNLQLFSNYLKVLYKKTFCEDFSPSVIVETVDGISPRIENSPPLEENLQPIKKPRAFYFDEEDPPEEKKPKFKRLFNKKEYDGEFAHYELPPISLLTDAKKIDQPSVKKDLKRQAEILEETLFSFGIEAKVGDIYSGPTITSIEVHPAIGVKVQKIKTLENDIALNLQAKSIRIIAPIPGKAAVGVEIPSLIPQEVGFKEMLVAYQKQRKPLHIPILLGKTVSGEDVIGDLTKMPHCLIAGATGAGKSVCINTIIMSILMNARPDEIKLLLIDPKKVELTPYTSLPHMLAPVITEPHGAYAALNWLVKEMQNRYEILKQLGLRNITAFNERKADAEFEASLNLEIPQKMPWIVMIIDEFADLMMTSSSDLETPIARIAQMARAVGIHLIIATQRPSREVITGLIKANFPTRIGFKVSSRINSQIILDENGAESLLGNGDMLFLPPGSSGLIRAQGVYIRDDDINQVINFICSQASANYLIKSFDSMSLEDMFPEAKEQPKDSLYEKALETVVESKNASTTFLQRKLKIGYARAASLMDELEARGIIGPQEGSKPRKILVSLNQLKDNRPLA